MTGKLLRVAWALLLVALPCVAAPQASPDSQARALLEDGRAYWNKKQYKLALENFNTIVTGFSQTDCVDNALLEIGRYYLEVEPSSEKARGSFEEVVKRYPQSDGAPGAYYYLGMIGFAAAKTPAELDDAIAQFKRLQRLYPRSREWVPRALHATGLAHRKAGRLQDAIEAERRVALEHPTSDVTAAAQFQIGLCYALLGEPLQAMEELQQVRNHFPESDWAPLALDRVTALYRLHGGAKPVFTRDPSYAVAAGDGLKDVRAILMTPARTLWIASEKVKSALSFETDGRKGTSLSVEDVRSLSLSPKGDLLIAARAAVRIGPRDIKTFAIPSDKPGVMKNLDKIAAAVITPGGSLLVSDDDKGRVYRYDAESQYVGNFPDAKERQVTRMTVDSEGGIVLLDRDAKVVGVFDEAGKLLRSVGPKGAGFEFKKPADVAVDPFRNLYVADEEGGVFVFSPTGQLLVTITGEDMKRPKALTLDTDGSILVYDERAEKVLRYK
jgi:TolA-binding protein